MASTNKTTNYELSQFLGTDKPGWLPDYNQDMSKIDTGIHEAQSTATGADGKADANTNNIGDLTNLNTTAKTSLVDAVNEVNSATSTAQGTASAAATTANQAATDISKFNLSVTGNCTVEAVIGGNTVTISDQNMRYAKDSTNSVFKFYGYLVLGNLNGISGGITVTIKGANLNPDSQYTINAAGLRLVRYGSSNAYEFISSADVTVLANGDIQMTWTLDGNVRDVRYIFNPCLYFNKSFGD